MIPKTNFSRVANGLLLDGNDIILSYIASYDVGLAFSCWRPGNLYLDKKKLFFVQAKKILFQIPLKDIEKIDIEKRGWILGKKVNQLSIQWNNDRARHIFIAVKDPDNWKRTIETLKKQILLLDIFEEGNNVVIISEIQAVCEKEINLKIEQKKITITFKNSNGIEQAEEINLPCEVGLAQFSKTFNNQILTIRLLKK